MAQEQKDLEAIERLIFKQGDDVAVSVARSFERLEECIGGAESRLHRRLAGLDDSIEGERQGITDELGDVRSEVRELVQSREEKSLSLD